jgi:hypothetical protein
LKNITPGSNLSQHVRIKAKLDVGRLKIFYLRAAKENRFIPSNDISQMFDRFQFQVELGLINEQINWKQRFFVPSDDTSGIDIFESLLERYPVMLTEDTVSDDESTMVEIRSQSEVRATEIVDLDQWIVAIGKASRTANG